MCTVGDLTINITEMHPSLDPSYPRSRPSSFSSNVNVVVTYRASNNNASLPVVAGSHTDMVTTRKSCQVLSV